ncbi:MAG: DMT family transporter [Tateyamaria sp.]|nr:DMT family transporter [Tateyamaria sp.]MDG1420280.1 DMT family transporter [Tateyamaria sp.]MDG1680106.1 DMT family transporter [Tateyamaria sp.]MDG2378002.1 DMT family transporter [Tateyamaria sp.]
MTLAICLLVLSAALLHAVWNALVKGSDDKAIVLGLISLGHVIPGLFIVMVVPLPPIESVPYIIASTIIHWVYYYLLNTAYRIGDFSIIYPIARGLAPVLIALGSQIWIGEKLPILAWTGILTVSGGIMILTRGSFSGAIPPSAIVAAVGVALAVTAYSLVDGVGIRISGNALSYIGWLFVNEIFVAAFIFSSQFKRLRVVSVRTLYIGFAGGVISGLAYAMVLYAKTLAPLGIISALRETSVIFAAIIGVIWFKEGPRNQRLFAALIVVVGIGLIAVSA